MPPVFAGDRWKLAHNAASKNLITGSDRFEIGIVPAMNIPAIT
jgi:hypothetical protein